MKRITKLATIIILCMTASFAKAQEYSVASPDGKIKVTVSLADGITYEVHYGNEPVLTDCRISLDINGKVLGSAPSLKMYGTSLEDGEKAYIYLLDEAMHMDKIGLISTNLAEKIAMTVTESPYRVAADAISSTCGQSISAGGAWNMMQRLGERISEEERSNLRKEISDF